MHDAESIDMSHQMCPWSVITSHPRGLFMLTDAVLEGIHGDDGVCDLLAEFQLCF